MNLETGKELVLNVFPYASYMTALREFGNYCQSPLNIHLNCVWFLHILSPSLRHLFIKGERAVSSLPSCSWNMQTMPMACELCNCFTEVAITNTTAFFPSPLLSPGWLYRVLWCNLTPGDLHVFLVWQWTAFSRARSLVRCVCCSSRACPKTFQGVVTRCPLWSSLLTVIPVRMPFLFMAQPCVSGLWRVLLLGVGIPRWPITTV